MPQRKVKMTQALAGAGYSHQAGEIVELPEAVAEAWVIGGIAEYEGKAEGATPSAKPKAKRGRKATRPPAEQRDK